MALALDRAPLLRPVAAMAGWTFAMEAWMYATRIPAISKYKVSTNPTKVKEEMNTKIPPHIRFIADNFNHLHEQPTVFYAVAIALALAGDGHKYTEYGAWSYVGVRIVHSLFQSLVNKVEVRFPLFLTSSIICAGLTGRLAQLVF